MFVVPILFAFFFSSPRQLYIVRDFLPSTRKALKMYFPFFFKFRIVFTQKINLHSVFIHSKFVISFIQPNMSREKENQRKYSDPYPMKFGAVVLCTRNLSINTMWKRCFCWFSPSDCFDGKIYYEEKDFSIFF